VRSLAALTTLALLATAGCAQTVRVKTEPPGAAVTLNDVTLGPVDQRGREVQVKPGNAPVTWEAEHDGAKADGEIARSEIEWLWVVAGVGAAAVCAPALAIGGVCLANPAVALAALSCALGTGPTVCLSVAATPGWLTVPLGAAGAAIGLSPLGLAVFAQRVPDEVVLTVAPPPGEPGEQEQAF
jgi:hypothetical protein